MPFNDIISPRPEVLKKEGLEGVIDIENLRDKKLKSIESRPEAFFDLTYPTTEIRMVISHLNERFNFNERTSGLFLLEGFKGSGKSHLELLIFHLMQSRESADKWLSKYNIDFKAPENVITIIHKFTDFPIDSIWSLVFEKLGKKYSHDRLPNLDEFRDALGEKKLVLILDELETGIRSIVNENLRARNLSFLQMLSEESLRTEDASVTLFASIYDSSIEPGTTLKRVNPIDVKFSENEDRLRVLQHRLFVDFENLSNQKVDAVINSYVNAWKRQGIEIDENQREKLLRFFPFSPLLIQTILYNAKTRGGFQGTRGALGLLAIILRNAYKKVDLITSSQLNISDGAIRNRLTDLDNSKKLIECALTDLQDLHTLPFISEIIGPVLMSTLAPTGKVSGLNINQISTEVLKPGDDVNSFNSTVRALEKLGTYFHHQEDSYYFDIEEKPNAKVEYKSLNIDSIKAREHSLKLWKEQFKDPNAVVYKDVNQVRADLLSRDKNSLRIVLSPSRLNQDERQSIYNGAENRNQIILIEPKDSTFNGLLNSDILKWAQSSMAAGELEEGAADERKRQYNKIKNDNNSFIKDAFKRAGLIYIWFQENGLNEGLTVEEESLGSSISRDDVIKVLSEEIFPRQNFEEHLLEHKEDIFNKSVREIELDYKKTLGFPVHTHLSIFLGAIKSLCKDARIGIRHERESACGRNPGLTESELLDAKVVEPFHDSSNSTLDLSEKEESFKAVMKETSYTHSENNTEEISINGRFETIYTPSKESVGSLRNEVASKLNEFPDSKIKTVVFLIFSEQKNIELSSLPSSLRGSLTGNSDLTLDMSIRKHGDFTKAQIEDLIEMLPVISNAQYKAELKISVNQKSEING